MPIPNSQTHRFTYPQTFSTQHHHSYTTNPTNIWSAHFQLHQTPKILRNITVIPHRPKTRDTLKRTYTHPPSTHYPSSKRRLLLSTPHAALHQQHHTSTQPTNRDHADITHQTTIIISAPQSSNICKQYNSHLLVMQMTTNHPNTKTTHTNATQKTQHTTHKSQNRRDQTHASKHQHTPTPTPKMITVPDPIPQLFRKQINPIITNILMHHSNPPKVPLTTKSTHAATYRTPQTWSRWFILNCNF